MKGKILGSRYKVLEYIAMGGFGKTYLAEDTQLPEKDRCVVKQLYPSSEEPQFLSIARRLFKTEASTLHLLGDHDQIPKLLAYFEEEEKFYLVQQYIAGQTLEKELDSETLWSETQVIELLRDVLGILEFIHSKGVIHRDIKPDNLIRRHEDGKLVLVDFGTVKEVLKGQTNIEITVAVGTQGYMPTEQARGKPRPSSDLYALGMICIQALTGTFPLDLEEDAEGEIIWQPLADVSPQLATILTRMTKYHFKDRYQSATVVLQALDSISDANSIEPQPENNPAESLLDSSEASNVTPVFISPFAETKPINTPNLPNLDESNLDQEVDHHSDYVYTSKNKIAVTRVEPIAFQNLNNKQLQSQPTNNNSSNKTRGNLAISRPVIWAIALLTTIVGGGYLFTQFALEQSPTNPATSNDQPDSDTPRIDQGKGFRKNL
ncbi:MAG: protein kinase domain-containing protein [Waterburya sp.]